MYFSYAMVVAIVIISLAVLSLLTGWHWKVKFAIALAVVLALTPPMVTISRVLWIWFDRKIDPGGP
jgi:4-amino-4-deoxy-L-arabinose transferase-like glycosyltransferase